jgi:DNA-binding MarR family transcriptional regulator
MIDPAVRRYIVESQAECALANVRRASRALTGMYDDALAPVGLRSTQFTLLAQIAATDGIAMTELADQLGMDRTTLTRNLTPLVRERWLRIEAAADRRVRLVSVTPSGFRLLAQAAPLRAAAQERVVAALGRERYQEWLGLLDHVAEAAPTRSSASATRRP